MSLRAAVLVALLVAGCATEPPEPPPPATTLHGWVRDAALHPVPGAEVGLVHAANGTPGPATVTDADGHYAFGDVPDGDLLLHASAVGYGSSSLALTPVPGAPHLRNLTLQREPAPRPPEVLRFQGFIDCSGFVAAGHGHGGGDPEGEDTVSCSAGGDAHVWDLELPPDVAGLLLEIAWDPGTQLAENLLVLVHHVDDGTEDVIGFGEGPSVLRVGIARLVLEDRYAAGGLLRVDVQIGGGPDQEDVAAGLAFQQPFDVYASLFYDAPPPVGYAFVD